MSKKNIVIVSLLVFGLLISPLVRWLLLNKFPTDASATLIVGTNAEYAPFTFVENNQIIGFDIDIVKEVASRLNKKIKIVDMPFDSLIQASAIGRIHILAAGMTSTKDRAKKVLFTKPYFYGDPLVIISSKSAPLKSLEDLVGKKIVVNEGYTADLYITSVVLEGTEIIRLNSPLEGFMALNAGRADAFIVTRTILERYFENAQKKDDYLVSIISDPKAADNYSLAISKKHPYLSSPIEKALDAMEKEGVIASLKAKWKLQ